jgi:hypothetical protein
MVGKSKGNKQVNKMQLKKDKSSDSSKHKKERPKPEMI